MKQILKKIVVFILTLEAKLVLKKYKPKIIAVTGSVGKTFSKDAIYTVLSSYFFVRKSKKSFNSEIGVPLAILGLPNAWNSVFLWLKNIIDGLKIIVLKNHYPKWLILEVGADMPRDIKSISKWLKPDIVIMTYLPDVPAHIEFFNSIDDLIREKSYLVEALKDDGILIANNDDQKLSFIKKFTERKKVLTYGFNKGSDITASNENIIYENNKPTGITFRIDYIGNSIPIKLGGIIGKQHIYPVLSAFLVGISQNLDLLSIKEIIEKHESAQGRMRLIDGVNNSIIIDDSYNASPKAVTEALNSLKSINTNGRKIAVLGDMMELGSHSYDEHIKIGKLTAQTANMLIIVGVRAKYIAQSAIEEGMKKRDIFEFNNSKSAGYKLAEILQEGDIALVKGSQSVRMEKVVENVMAQPEKRFKLLVRQEKEWIER